MGARANGLSSLNKIEAICGLCGVHQTYMFVTDYENVAINDVKSSTESCKTRKADLPQWITIQFQWSDGGDKLTGVLIEVTAAADVFLNVAQLNCFALPCLLNGGSIQQWQGGASHTEGNVMFPLLRPNCKRSTAQHV